MSLSTALYKSVRSIMRLFLLVAILAGMSARAGAQTQTVTDIDGNVYQTVQIGDQLWMAENLNVTRYADGTDIANETDDAVWAGLTTGAWAYYGNDSANKEVYGKLYNGYAAADSRGLCPAGWHVPTDAEWTALSNYLGGLLVAGDKMKATGTQYWASPNTGATNESGFTALPGGFRDIDGSFYDQGIYAALWSSSEYSSDYAWFRHLDYVYSGLGRNYDYKSYGFSVRCLRDIDALTLSDVEVDSVTSTSATLRSQVRTDGGSTVTRRGVVWGESADPDLASHGGVVDASQAGTGAFTVQITGLSPSTSYHARAFAINATDTAYSAPVSFTTFTEVTVTDVEGNMYNTVQIGDQVWMAENLRTSRYADGTAIANVTDYTHWGDMTSGAWVHYGNDSANEAVHGKLYNGYAAVDSRGLCPQGWHVPTDAEWTDLSNHLGGESVAGGKMKATGTQYWTPPNTDATNESGFTGLPGGYRYFNGLFYSQGDQTIFWSSSESSSDFAWYRSLYYDNSELIRDNNGKRNGLSVRCLRDIDPLTLSIADARVDSITASSANVSSEVQTDGGSTVTRRGVVWGESADPDLAGYGGVVDASQAGTGAFTVRITGLSRSTSYHARAFAINATDTAYSAPVSFTTLVEQVALSATSVLQDGTASVDVSVLGLTAEDRIYSYEFDLPLPAHVLVDSLPTTGTQSESSTGELVWNVVEADGQRVLKAVYADSEPLAGGESPLFTVAVRLTSQDSTVLQPSRFVLNTQEVADLGSVRLEFAPMMGDVDGNGTVQAFDAAVVLQHVVGLDPLPEVDPMPWDAGRMAAADVDGDGMILAMDASWILQYLVELIADWPVNTAGKAPAAPLVEVRSTGDEVVFTVAAGGLTAFQVDLPLAAGLQFGEPTATGDGEGEGEFLAVNQDTEAGVIRIALAGVESAQGAFLRVPYTLDPSVMDGARTLPLEIAAMANTEGRTLGVELMASGTGVSTGPDGAEPLPERFELRANYPNPFNPATQIRFALPEASEVRLEVFDAAGRRVAVLADGMRSAGVHTVSFQAGSLSSGVYIARLTAPGFVQSRAMVLLK